MRGIIFTEFARFVEDRLGLVALDAALTAADLPSGGAYTSVGSYPYSELEALLAILVRQHEALRTNDALRDYGLWLADRFQTLYQDFFTPHDNAIDFLASIDGHIHTEVRKLDPEAVPPQVIVTPVDGGRYRLSYRSHRPLAWVAIGLTQGALNAYGGHWDIVDMAMTDAGKSMSMYLVNRAAVSND